MTENQKQPATDEIDLLQLLAKIALLIRANFKVIVFAFFIGAILGLAFYQFSPKVYESRMLISSDILTESYSKPLVEDLEKLAKEKNFTTLSSKLKLTVQQAAALGKIKIENATEKGEVSKEQEKNYLTVTCQSQDNSIWPSLQNGLINFFETNNFVNIRVEQRKKFFNELIEKLNHEIADLEILKIKIMNGELSSKSKENMVLMDPTTINSELIELNIQKMNFMNSLEIANSVQLVEGFTIFEKPTSPKLSISLVVGSSFGLFCVFLVIGFKSIRKVIRLSEEKLGKS